MAILTPAPNRFREEMRQFREEQAKQFFNHMHDRNGRFASGRSSSTGAGTAAISKITGRRDVGQVASDFKTKVNRIIYLTKQGQTHEQIAQATGLGLGYVRGVANAHLAKNPPKAEVAKPKAAPKAQPKPKEPGAPPSKHAAWGDRAKEIDAAKTHPDGFKNIDVVRSTFEGTFAGLTTKIMGYNPESGTVSGVITNSKGERIGRFNRMFRFENGTVDHGLLELNPDVQGGGFAREFNRNAENHYIANGIKAITLHADISVGGYAWARQGYDFDDKHALKSFKDSLTFYLERDLDKGYGNYKTTYRVAPAHRAELKRQIDAAEHAWDLAALTVGGVQYGKQWMLGSDWFGRKNLSPGDPTSVVGEVAYQSKAKKK